VSRPLDAELQGYLDWLVSSHGREVRFVVLYGSRARNEARRGSDYDLLIGLRDESDERFLDRLLTFSNGDFPRVEAKAFTPSEIEGLWLHYGRTLIDALYEGIPLVDRGGWAELRQRFSGVMDQGILERRGRAWVWHRELEPVDSPRRLAPLS